MHVYKLQHKQQQHTLDPLLGQVLDLEDCVKVREVKQCEVPPLDVGEALPELWVKHLQNCNATARLHTLNSIISSIAQHKNGNKVLPADYCTVAGLAQYWMSGPQCTVCSMLYIELSEYST